MSTVMTLRWRHIVSHLPTLLGGGQLELLPLAINKSIRRISLQKIYLIGVKYDIETNLLKKEATTLQESQLNCDFFGVTIKNLILRRHSRPFSQYGYLTICNYL